LRHFRGVAKARRESFSVFYSALAAPSLRATKVENVLLGTSFARRRILAAILPFIPRFVTLTRNPQF
jgi:hypothetical protein